MSEESDSGPRIWTGGSVFQAGPLVYAPGIEVKKDGTGTLQDNVWVAREGMDC